MKYIRSKEDSLKLGLSLFFIDGKCGGNDFMQSDDGRNETGVDDIEPEFRYADNAGGDQ